MKETKEAHQLDSPSFWSSFSWLWPSGSHIPSIVTRKTAIAGTSSSTGVRRASLARSFFAVRAVAHGNSAALSGQKSELILKITDLMMTYPLSRTVRNNNLRRETFLLETRSLRLITLRSEERTIARHPSTVATKNPSSLTSRLQPLLLYQESVRKITVRSIRRASRLSPGSAVSGNMQAPTQVSIVFAVAKTQRSSMIKSTSRSDTLLRTQ